jgi:hypothetical protein
MVLAKITIEHEHSTIVMGVAAYHGLVCATLITIVEFSCFIVILATTISAP